MPRTAPQPAPPPVPSSTHSDLPVPRRGRTAVSMFPNNISNVDPTDYMWVKSHSNHTLCHKVASDVQPTRALFWIVGDIDSHCQILRYLVGKYPPLRFDQLVPERAPEDWTLQSIYCSGPLLDTPGLAAT